MENINFLSISLSSWFVPIQNGCMYDDNWGKCRPSNECDYTYRYKKHARKTETNIASLSYLISHSRARSPEPMAMAYGRVNEDSVNMNTACFVRADQCYRGGGGIIDTNAGGDACTRATTCGQVRFVSL